MLEMVQFEAEDGLRLNGVIAGGSSATTVIHVHGKCGNFYENKFLRTMYYAYEAAGINLLGFNNRGTACYTEASRRGRTCYIGTAIERFEECVLDLAGAVEFARRLGPNVILQGHSFGCEKVMYYGMVRDSGIPLVVLSPSDGYALQSVFIEPVTVEDQIQRLRNDYSLEGMEWLPDQEYGIRGPGIDYHVPITASALHGLLTGPAFQLLRLGIPWSGPVLENPSFVFLGGKDGLQVDGSDVMTRGLLERFRSHQLCFYPESDHHLRPQVSETITDILQWISTLPFA